MMSRTHFISGLAVGVIGSLVLLFSGQVPLLLGWWLGILIAAVNFLFLVGNMKRYRGQGPSASEKSSRNLGIGFFARYVALAAAFFLILQLGRRQFGSSLIAFVSFYVAFFFVYLLQARKPGAR